MTDSHSEAERCLGIVVSAKKAVLRDEKGDRVLVSGRPTFEDAETFGFIVPKRSGFKKVFFHVRNVPGGRMPAIGAEVSYTLVCEPDPNKCDSAIEVVVMSEPNSIFSPSQQHETTLR